VARRTTNTATPSLTRRERDARYTALGAYFDVARRVPLADLAEVLGTTDDEPSERLGEGAAALLQHHRDESESLSRGP
jgi:predicted DNA binding protein